MLDLHKNGYYTVGQQIYYSKTQALIEATQVNILPEWHYNDDVFGQVKWEQPAVLDLRQAYQQRARQLRDKYDYLILSYSGGSDTWTALHSFLSAGIAPDEILIRWPIKATEGRYQVTNMSQDSTNLLSEWDFVIKHDLAFIAKNYPNIKLTVYDWSDDINDDIVENDWYSVNDHMNPGVFRKFTVVGERERQMLDAGKKTAIIWGIDKPQVKFDNGNLYLYFLDKLANTRCVDAVQHRNAELFYWSPDCTELVHAQAQIVYDYFVQNPEQVSLVDWTGDRAAKKQKFDTIVRGLVYPDWNTNKFQALKPDSMVWCGNDGWMFQNLTDHRYLQSWKHGLDSIKNAVDKKYHQISTDGRFDGWNGFISPMYKLGPIHSSIVA